MSMVKKSSTKFRLSKPIALDETFELTIVTFFEDSHLELSNGTETVKAFEIKREEEEKTK